MCNDKRWRDEGRKDEGRRDEGRREDVRSLPAVLWINRRTTLRLPPKNRHDDNI
jgi:hypothetical protein